MEYLLPFSQKKKAIQEITDNLKNRKQLPIAKGIKDILQQMTGEFNCDDSSNCGEKLLDQINVELEGAVPIEESNGYDTTVIFETVEEITSFFGLENLLILKTSNDIKKLNNALKELNLEGGGKKSKKKKTAKKSKKGKKSKSKKVKKSKTKKSKSKKNKKTKKRRRRR